MTKPRSLMHRLAHPWSRALARVDPRAFYIGLAVLLGIFSVVNNLSYRDHRQEASSYDWMLTHRFRVPVPDPDIVLVDILIADADRRNPVSERAFEDAVAKTRTAYFAVLRLSPSSDATSTVHTGDLPGLVVSKSGAALAPGSGPTIAVSLPYIESVIRSGRLGTDNVDPDADSVIRRYRVFEDLGDHRVLSLPARLALDFGWRMPAVPEKALRFNDSVLAYPTVSFGDLFADLMKKQRKRPADEFRGKIVVVGATASGLFDLKGTPISRIHPGMDILATAIDDIRNDRFIDELSPSVDIAIAVALLCLMTWLCIRYSHEQLRLAFVIAPGLLFVISYLTLNLSKVFVDLSQPASIAFVYFSVVKLYSVQVRRRWSEGELFAPLLEPRVAHWVGCLATALHPTKRVPGFETRYLNQLRTVAPDVRITSGLDAQSWLGSAFSGVLVATWVEHADDAPAIERDREQAKRLFVALQSLSPNRPQETMFFREGSVPADVPAVVPIAPEDATMRAGTRSQSPVPARLNLLRSLVSRTVLQLTEDSRR